MSGTDVLVLAAYFASAVIIIACIAFGSGK
jgi:hypothetical protein